MSSFSNFGFRDIEFLPEDFYELICEDLLGRKCDEGVQETYLSGSDLFYIILNVLCIRGDNRAVVVVISIWELFTLIRNARVEDEINIFLDQPLDVSVGKLCRITFGFRRNGFDT